MSNMFAWRRSNPVVGVVLAVLVVFEVVFLTSGLHDGVRYGLGGAAALGSVLLVMQFSANRRQETTDRRKSASA
jgi:hypothetical protein